MTNIHHLLAPSYPPKSQDFTWESPLLYLEWADRLSHKCTSYIIQFRCGKSEIGSP